MLLTSLVIVFFSIAFLGLALKNKERRQQQKGLANSCASGCVNCSCSIQSNNHCQEK